MKLYRTLSNIVKDDQSMTIRKQMKEIEDALYACNNIPLVIVLIEGDDDEEQDKEDKDEMKKSFLLSYKDYRISLQKLSKVDTSKQIIQMVHNMNTYGTIENITEDAITYVYHITNGIPLHTKTVVLLCLEKNIIHRKLKIFCPTFRGYFIHITSQ